MFRRFLFAKARVAFAPLSFAISPGDCFETQQIIAFRAKSSRSKIIEFEDGQK
jgi:hypothetical protein